MDTATSWTGAPRGCLPSPRRPRIPEKTFKVIESLLNEQEVFRREKQEELDRRDEKIRDLEAKLQESMEAADRVR